MVDSGANNGIVGWTKLKAAESKSPMTSALDSRVATTPILWTELESTNYTEYIANLRKIGCPEETIRDIIVEDVGKAYGSRLQELRSGPRNFWESSGDVGQREWQARQIEKERSVTLKQLLGTDAESDLFRVLGKPEPFSRITEFLSGERREETRGILKAYQEREDEMYIKASGAITSEDRVAIAQIQQERLAELSRVLSTAELREFELRASETAKSLQYKLALFRPTEQEFRAIFEITKEDGQWLRNLNR